MSLALMVLLLIQPATCVVGSAYTDDDGALYVCVPTATWKFAEPEPIWRWLLRQEGIL